MSQHALPKRLKRRILILCGLINLNKEEKVNLAAEILSDSKYKQKLANSTTNVSTKDIDSVLQDLINNTEIKRKNAELTISKEPNKTVLVEYLLDSEEVNKLLNASDIPFNHEVKGNYYDQYTYSKEEAQQLISDDKKRIV